jgi:hypothetical protein
VVVDRQRHRVFGQVVIEPQFQQRVADDGLAVVAHVVIQGMLAGGVGLLRQLEGDMAVRRDDAFGEVGPGRVGGGGAQQAQRQAQSQAQRGEQDTHGSE